MDTAALDLQLVTPAIYADDAAYHGLFRQLRKEDPVHWTAPPGFRPFRTISKHADIKEVELQADKFTNDPRTTLALAADEDMVRLLNKGNPHIIRSLNAMDDPDHRLFRHLTFTWFSSRNIAKLEAELRTLAREFIGGRRAREGCCDFVADVTDWYPLRGIMAILGLPREDSQLMLRLTRELFGLGDPDRQRDAGGLGGFLGTFKEMSDYLTALTEARRAEPRDDVASVIANAQIGDAPIAQSDALAYYIILATAGHDTTGSSAAGRLLALLQYPAEPTAVDEFIRWTTPVKHFFRTAKVDYLLRGRRIKAGQSLLMCYPSANRDEDVFEAPDTFRIDRSPNRHIAFGFGPHVCLGQHLAKLELRILFEELLANVRGIELAGAIASVQSCFVSGLKRLPIRYGMARQAPSKKIHRLIERIKS